MIATATLPAAPLPRRSDGARRGPFRDMLVAAAIVLSASAVLSAQEEIRAWAQDWVPSALRMPEDAEVLFAREIGSTVRMFSIATAEDADALFADWEETLRSEGFTIEQAADDILDSALEFSGTGITNAKIAVAPTSATELQK
jgi:hypothetical protein